MFHKHKYLGAHLGEARICEKIKKRFFWPSMSSDIKAVIKSCEECQITRLPNKPIIQPLNPIKKFPRPFYHVHVDIIGPLERTNKGNEYILTIVDAFTKFIITAPMKNQKANTVAIKLIDNFFTKYGCPKIISSD
jgi:transposase InsO family protein